MNKKEDATQQLNRLSLIHFKNHNNSEFQFCPKINCLVGFNGTGKTNVLDAIYYLSMTKSCFNTADSQNIRYDDDFFVVQGEYIRKGTPENIYCGVKRGQKKLFRRNMKDYERMSEHIGLLPVVMVSPTDNNLIIGGSDERRRFINEVISQYDRHYLDNMMHYNRALEQRNALLKSFAENRTFDRDMLEVWNEQLVRTGNLIFQSRMNFCMALIPVFQEYYRQIAGSDEQVELVYRSQLQENDFAALLGNTEEKDRALQFTTCGVHKDDLLLLMNGIPIKKAGSQGQQKTFLVALKLANSDFIRLHCNITPLLLLDDIFDKFDASRVSHIVRLVSGDNFGQIFITDTGREHIENILKQTNCTYQLFEITSQKTND
ncbi:MAG: DNA replication and repair protein RecF [Bacteroidales bacterium]|jgi:DNA replication and repair protein RecF|nr:DNA replication and repair protein RecF [Bacteroidales bacterium]